MQDSTTHVAATAFAMSWNYPSNTAAAVRQSPPGISKRSRKLRWGGMSKIGAGSLNLASGANTCIGA